jgi:fumarate hydratase class II
VTALNRYLGYEAAAAVVKASLLEGRSIRDVVIARGHIDAGDLTQAQLDDALDVLSMTRPGSAR